MARSQTPGPCLNYKNNLTMKSAILIAITFFIASIFIILASAYNCNICSYIAGILANIAMFLIIYCIAQDVIKPFKNGKNKKL